MSHRFLLEGNYTKDTKRRYKMAVSEFVRWCCDRGFDDWYSIGSLDDSLVDYCHWWYLGGNGANILGKGRQKMVNTVYGIYMLQPRLRNLLKGSEAALRGWVRMHPPVARPPLSWDVSVAISIQLLRIGRKDMALATLVMFDGLLRISECINIKKKHVSYPGDVRFSGVFNKFGIALAKTKTGANQWAELRMLQVKQLLQDHLGSLPHANSRIFGFSADHYRNYFKSACASLGLRDIYRPHSLRHGGATYLNLCGYSIEQILLIGRWLSNKSARHYIQSGRAILLRTDVPLRIIQFGKCFSSHLPFIWSLISSSSTLQ